MMLEHKYFLKRKCIFDLLDGILEDSYLEESIEAPLFIFTDYIEEIQYKVNYKSEYDISLESQGFYYSLNKILVYINQYYSNNNKRVYLENITQMLENIKSKILFLIYR